ncbi:hypothetical protein V5O48_007184 [Marasmius crinis-equi]|uniref:Non-haem dioxygenase N-terminal domain-containing protein n=1 Tax=Marasmius crinis-equi TaxID=585013 RepID=A0ABR3FHD2_9AGAR
MPVPTLPPFPDNVPTHPLLVVDYKLLKAGNTNEINRLWDAATGLSFWYLKNHSVQDEVDGMFEMGEATMKLPMEEKMKYEQGDEGSSFGDKAAGANAVNATDLLDTAEFINIAKDDGFVWPKTARRTYPSTVNKRMNSTVVPFIKKSSEINTMILNIFNDKLSPPAGELAKRHRPGNFSGSKARTIKNPKGMPKGRMAIGAHTDFGSLSFLHNRLGGLQVLPPGIDEWQYVRLLSLSALSPTIAEAVERNTDKKKLDTGGVTAWEWFARRIKNQRIKNRKGPERWEASQGTEQGRA